MLQPKINYVASRRVPRNQSSPHAQHCFDRLIDLDLVPNDSARDFALLACSGFYDSGEVRRYQELEESIAINQGQYFCVMQREQYITQRVVEGALSFVLGSLSGTTSFCLQKGEIYIGVHGKHVATYIDDVVDVQGRCHSVQKSHFANIQSSIVIPPFANSYEFANNSGKHRIAVAEGYTRSRTLFAVCGTRNVHRFFEDRFPSYQKHFALCRKALMATI